MKLLFNNPLTKIYPLIKNDINFIPLLNLFTLQKNIVTSLMAIKSKSNKSVPGKGVIILFIAALLLIIGLLAGLKIYRTVFSPNVITADGNPAEIFIPSSPTFDEVVSLLEYSGVIGNMDAFIWVAKRKGYDARPRGGRYLLPNGLDNNQLVNLLRSGRQAPVNVTFNNIRTIEDLAGQLAVRLEPDSVDFLSTFKDINLLNSLEIEPHTLLGMILPNTYQMYWTASSQEFLKRMHQEYQRFWNATRLEKAKAAGLSPMEVATLASIVDEETIREDEKPRVAGLYINRLKRGMRLQADPTIKFAMGDFTVNRILTRDLEIDSPYNTYKYAGLPPGPIRMPSISGIEAVLNHEEHNYLYMCAKDDFSGYHAFARTLQQHNQNAARYRQALNRQRIFR